MAGTTGAGFWNLAGIGSILQGAGSIYAGYSQNKLGKKMFNLQKSYLDDEKKRKKRSQSRLDSASADAFGHRDNTPRLATTY